MTASIKGRWGGNCNRTACQQPGAVWWNASTRAFYCQLCAQKINEFSVKADGYALCTLSLDGQEVPASSIDSRLLLSSYTAEQREEMARHQVTASIALDEPRTAPLAPAQEAPDAQ